MAFTQKKCWHSHMRNHSPLVVRFKTSVLTSQYLKDDSLRIIYFDAAGQDPDDPDRMIVDTLEGKYYVIDDIGVREIMEQVQTDKWMVMTVGGGKNEEPWVKLEEYDGPLPLWNVNGEWVEHVAESAAPNKVTPRPSGNGSSVSAGLLAQNYAKDNIEDTYMECLSLSYAMQERFQAMYDREITFMDVELAQHVFAHWAIKGFDRPLYEGQEPKTPTVPVVPMAHEEHLNVIRDLAKLAAGSNPGILDSIEEKIAAGLTEEEAKSIIRDLTIAGVIEREPLWFDKKNHTYWVDGQTIPSVTRVIGHSGVATDYSMIDTGTMDGARSRGNIVHEIIHKHHAEGTSLRAHTHKQADACLRAYEQFLSDTGYTVMWTERQLYSVALWYAGTVDSKGWLFGKRTILDVKTSHDVNKQAVELQTAGYGWLDDENHPEEKHEGRVCLHLKKNGTYRLIRCEDPMALDKFVEALKSMQEE